MSFHLAKSKVGSGLGEINMMWCDAADIGFFSPHSRLGESAEIVNFLNSIKWKTSLLNTPLMGPVC